ncbi:MAG TPA: dockerin type I repeat-containing protein [Tepidisphaeraceae bacterium]|jgi:hypothetical protein|nr:dockerin type I repeat-containing protein [Tepidisphaeraceae bacterium]
MSHATPSRYSRRTTFLILTAALLPFPLPTHAASKTYVGSVNGSWALGTNWSLTGIPLAGDDVTFSSFVSSSSNFLYNGNYTPGAGALSSLTIDASTAGSLPFNFHQTLSTSNLYTAGNETVGVNNRAIYTQSAAINSANQLIIASSASSNATYSLSGTGSLAASYEYVGYNGNGSFIQSAGTNTLSNDLYLGTFQGATGTYSLSGTGSLAASYEVIGYLQLGSFVQTGGTNTITNDLQIDPFSSASSSYSLSGANSVLSANNETISAGSFNQSAGTNSLSQNLQLNALYSLSSTGTLTTSNNEILGTLANTSGTFIQSGGFNRVGFILSIGDAASSNGSYTLSGNADLEASHEYVGNAGSGTFIQTGGIHTINNDFSLAVSTGSTGFYSLSGTGSVTASSETIAAAGVATFSQSAGSNAPFAFTLASASTSTGTYSLTGTGTLSAYSENIGYSGHGSFLQQEGGANNVYDNLSIASNLGSTGNYSISDFYTLSTLSVGNSIFIGGSPTASGGTGTLQFFGGRVTVAGEIKVYNTPGSVLNLNFASLTVGSLDLSGNPAHFVWTAGTLTITDSLSIDSNTFTNSFLELNENMTLVNSGSITLSSATLISGDGFFNNTPAGTITGPGSILANFTNLGTVDLPAGNLHLSSFTNSGILQLDSPSSNLTGGPITNSSTIQGQGKISASLTNSSGATIEPAGTLVLSAALTNPAGGTLRIPASSKLLITGSFPTNAGSILLTGGTLDTSSQPLTNAGTISGYGTLATGTLTNTGSLQFSGGSSSITSPISASPSSKISVASTATATFYAPITLAAGSSFDVAPNATAVFFSSVTGPGSFTGTGVKDFESGSSSPSSIATPGSTTVESPASLTTSFLRESSLTSTGSISILPSSAGGQTSLLHSLTLTAGSFDLADNKLILDYTGPSPINTLRQYLQSNLLISSTAAADPQHRLTLGYAEASTLGLTSFGGLPVDSTSLLTKLTYLGDANLDGKITADDYALLDRSFNKHLADAHWTDGDFNYDGVVNAADYLLIDKTVTLQSGTFSPSATLLAQREAQFGDAYVTELLTSIPEPSLLVAFGLAAIPLIRARRR